MVAATDYVKLFQIKLENLSRNHFIVGTDGYGRSDMRKKQKFFEVSSGYIAFTAVHSLFKSKKVSKDLLKKAVKELKLTQKN